MNDTLGSRAAGLRAGSGLRSLVVLVSTAAVLLLAPGLARAGPMPVAVDRSSVAGEQSTSVTEGSSAKREAVPATGEEPVATGKGSPAAAEPAPDTGTIVVQVYESPSNFLPGAAVSLKCMDSRSPAQFKSTDQYGRVEFKSVPSDRDCTIGALHPAYRPERADHVRVGKNRSKRLVFTLRAIGGVEPIPLAPARPEKQRPV